MKKTIYIFVLFIFCIQSGISMASPDEMLINEAIHLKLSKTNHSLPVEVLRLQQLMTAEITKAHY